MGRTVGVLRALVDLWCFNLYHSEFLCSDQILNLLFLSLFDTCGWCDGFLLFRLTTGPPIRQSCFLSPFAHKVPSAYHPQEMHYELDAVLSVPH